jgi:Transcription factor WhiB
MDDTWPSMWNPRRKEQPVGPVALLEQILADQPKLEGAACRNHDPARFDLDTDGRGAEAEDILACIEICESCPVLRQCREWVLGPDSGSLIGVVAGIYFAPRTKAGTR